MRVRPAHERPGERNHREAAEADQTTKGGQEVTGPGEAEGQRPTPLLARGVQTESSQEAKTPDCGTLPDFRAYLVDQRMTRSSRGRPGKNAPTSPTLGIPSLEIRLREPDPKRVTPS